MNEHTKEPWQVNDQTASGVMNNSVYICDEAGLNIARVFNDYGNQIANARRIVACVNACAGVPTEELETGEVHVVIHRKLGPVDLPAAFPFEITREMEVDKLVLVSQRLQQQRDRLLAALNEILSFNLETDGATCEWPELVAAVINARVLINNLIR